MAEPVDVFPSLPGLAWSVMKVPRFKTRTQNAVSGRQLRIADQLLPIWTYTLTYDFLRDKNDLRAMPALGLGQHGPGYDELRTLMGFWLSRQGPLTTFLFDDPTDWIVASQVVGTGDGIATLFQLGRTFGVNGFFEPMIAPRTVLAVYDAAVEVDPLNYTHNVDTGILTFTAPPDAGHQITVDFSYWRRCRFSDDSAEFENFMYQLWTLKKLTFETILL
jgi:uncharacterized protein (TIGR02217 family)